MAKVPNFTEGKFGKLTHGDLNRISDAANDSRTPSEYSTPLGARGVAGKQHFPIFARLIAKIPADSGSEPAPLGGLEEPGDKVDPSFPFNGYDWIELQYDGETGAYTEAIEPRKYKEEYNNPAFALGVDYDPDSEDYSGSSVILHPMYDVKGRTMLVFQTPGASAPSTDKIGVISASQSLPCQAAPGSLYTVAIMRLSGSSESTDLSWVGTGEVVQAINLLEVSAGQLGGSVVGTDCDILSSKTPIPNGHYLKLKFLRLFEEKTDDGFDVITNLYCFSVANDLCVECCDEGMVIAASRERTRGLVPAPRTSNSIITEMQK